MTLDNKSIPPVKYILPEFKKEYRNADVNKKKYLWTRTLMKRLNALPEHPWMK